MMNKKKELLEKIKFLETLNVTTQLNVNPVIVDVKMFTKYNMEPNINKTWHLVGFEEEKKGGMKISRSLLGNILYVHFLYNNGYKTVVLNTRKELEQKLESEEYFNNKVLIENFSSFPLLSCGEDEEMKYLKILVNYVANDTPLSEVMYVNDDTLEFMLDEISYNIMEYGENSPYVITPLRKSLFMMGSMNFNTMFADALVRGKIINIPLLNLNNAEGYYYQWRLTFDILKNKWFPLNMDIIRQGYSFRTNESIFLNDMEKVTSDEKTLSLFLSYLPFLKNNLFDKLEERFIKTSIYKRCSAIKDYFKIIKKFRSMRDSDEEVGDLNGRKNGNSDKENGNVSYLKRIFG